MKQWYADGLSFECERCSACCRHEPGYVFLSSRDIRDLMEALALDFRSLLRNYCRIVDLGSHAALSLRETKNFDCILWGQGACTVYAHRPVQCRTYPFWTQVLATEAAWKTESASCPGIGKGRKRSLSEIESRLAERRESPALKLERGVRMEDLDEDSLLGR
ncbi:MAG: YkgJ family cysteine cluster protein [Spirochaetales bacterium]|nr:YkgJ family cysteine cluster protein [Spirochaetales bacterium]